MKYSSAIIISFLLLISTACGTSRSDKDNAYSGTIQPAGITSYQYGTHILKAENTFYALKSDNIELGDYEGEKVSLQAEKVEGYPVDGGPVYLNVTKINE